MSRLVQVLNIGKISYKNGLRLQKHFIDSHFSPSSATKDTLLIVEHKPVYTIGIRTKSYTDSDEERLKNLGAEFYKTNRGGLITFHGPGQLVAYPILNLKHFQPSVKWYVCHIEKTIIDLCKKFNLNAETSIHTGVWIGDNKICAVGMHASRYVTSHGLALNCNVDLNWFKHIVPCGIEDKFVTSLSNELNRQVTISETLPLFLNSFSNIFQCECIQLPDDNVKKIVSQVIK